MAEWMELTAADGQGVRAYVARPKAEPNAALVIVPEIFGVTPHIRAVAEQYSELGYLCIAPAYFDRYERGFERPYDEQGLMDGVKAMQALGWKGPLLDTEAAVAWLHAETPKKVGLVGYCWGGSLAWLAASRVAGLSATVAYYGRLAVSDLLEDAPRIPVMMHFGGKDESIPLEQVADLQAKYPGVPVFIYEDAGHAFNRAGDVHFVAGAAGLALSRTLDHFQQYLEK